MTRRTPISQFVSTAGVTFEVIKSLSDAVINAGGGDEDLRRITADPQLAADLAARILAAKADPSAVHPLTIDYNLSIEQMVEAGRFDGPVPDITSASFPHRRNGVVTMEAVMVGFDRKLLSSAARSELCTLGLRPPIMAELLSFGTQYPELQRQFTIVGLGLASSGQYEGYVGWLDGDSTSRNIGMCWQGRDWDTSHRFLGVRE